MNEVKNYERDVDVVMRLKEEDMAMNAQQDSVSGLGPGRLFHPIRSSAGLSVGSEPAGCTPHVPCPGVR